MDDKQLLANLYQKIYDLLTSSPKGAEDAGINPSNMCVQMTQNEVLNLQDFANAISGSNPGGSLRAAEAISGFVDKIPNLSDTRWVPKEGLAKFYQSIVSGANVKEEYLTSQEQNDLYKRLQSYLRVSVIHTSLVTGKETTTMENSSLFTAYLEAREEYASALFDAAQVVIDADLSTPIGQRQANLDKRRADEVVKQKYKAWIAAGKSDVNEILSTMESIKNNAISGVISDAKSVMDPTNWIPSSNEFGEPWRLVSVTPSNWTEPSCKGTLFTLKQDQLKTSTSTSGTTYANNSRGWFWYGDSSNSGTIETKDVDLKTESFTLNAEMVLVRIHRPWLNEQLFTMRGWDINGYEVGKISDGKGNGGFPGIPTAFVMMRNVSIEAKFNETDSKFIKEKSESSSSSGWGWGPFGDGNHRRSSESTSDKFESTANGVKLSFSQPQLVAWISTLVPFSPPAK